MTAKTTSHHRTVSNLQSLLYDGTIIAEPAEIAAISASSAPESAGQQPACVVQPANRDELSSLVTFANETRLNLTVTSSTGIHRSGGISNPEENILIDLSGWRNIDLIDRRNRVCRIEPGVTYGQLAAELARHGLTLPVPLAPRSGKSVLASVMDRKPATWPNRQWDAGDPVGSTEFIFGNGQRFRTGAAGGPGTIEQQRLSGGAQKFSSGPSQADFHRVVQGAQGTLALLTWITLRTELKPSQQHTFLIGCQELDDLLPFVYAVQRGLLGEHSFILNRTAAAMLLAEGDRAKYDEFRSTCPAYICLQNVAGFERLPGERLAYQVKEIRATAHNQNLRLEEQLGGISSSRLLAIATQPCGEIEWRDQRCGGSLSIFFISTLDRMPAFCQLSLNIAEESGIPPSEIGIYIQPIVQNHACHIEFIVPYDPNSDEARGNAKRFERLATRRLMEAGAFFSRPYGAAADLVWSQNPANYQLLKVVKEIFDPNRVLQRGKWGL